MLGNFEPSTIIPREIQRAHMVRRCNKAQRKNNQLHCVGMTFNFLQEKKKIITMQGYIEDLMKYGRHRRRIRFYEILHIRQEGRNPAVSL